MPQQFSKIQVIKLLRQHTGLGLKECKDVVDKYELETFEERAISALSNYYGPDKPVSMLRSELRDWAYLFVATMNRGNTVKYEYRVQDSSDLQYPDVPCSMENPCNTCREENYPSYEESMKMAYDEDPPF